MTQRSKPTRYYHEDAVRGMLRSATKGRENDVSKWIDPELTIRPEVAAFAQAMEGRLNLWAIYDKGSLDNVRKSGIRIAEDLANDLKLGVTQAGKSYVQELAVSSASIVLLLSRLLDEADVKGGLKGE